LKQQLLRTGTIEPLVAFYFSDHIEQVQFEDPSILEHFDVRTARSFEYLRTLARINKPQATLITLDVRMGLFESEDTEVVADTTAIFCDDRFSPFDDSGHRPVHALKWAGRRVKGSLLRDAW
jgi:hypothetical protein